LREADFPKLLRYLGFGKSYLIPETTNFGIGEGIVHYKRINNVAAHQSLKWWARKSLGRIPLLKGNYKDCI